jgi:hypothetical protein
MKMKKRKQELKTNIYVEEKSSDELIVCKI